MLNSIFLIAWPIFAQHPFRVQGSASSAGNIIRGIGLLWQAYGAPIWPIWLGGAIVLVAAGSIILLKVRSNANRGPVAKARPSSAAPRPVPQSVARGQHATPKQQPEADISGLAKVIDTIITPVYMEHRQKLWDLAQGDASLERSYSILHRRFRRSPRNFAIDLVPTIQGIEQFVTAEDKNAGQFERAHRSLQFSRSLRNVRAELIRALGDNLKEKGMAQEEVNNIIKTLQLPFDGA